MNKTLTIVARIETKIEKIELVRSELIKLIEPTRKEQGCILYDLHQDNDNPEIFIFYEKWKNRELWQTHMKNDHLKVYMEATDGAVVDFTLNEMSQIGES